MKKRYIFGRLTAIKLDNDNERIHDTPETQDLMQIGPDNKNISEADSIVILREIQWSYDTLSSWPRPP